MSQRGRDEDDYDMDEEPAYNLRHRRSAVFQDSDSPVKRKSKSRRSKRGKPTWTRGRSRDEIEADMNRRLGGDEEDEDDDIFDAEIVTPFKMRKGERPRSARGKKAPRKTPRVTKDDEDDDDDELYVEIEEYEDEEDKNSAPSQASKIEKSSLKEVKELVMANTAYGHLLIDAANHYRSLGYSGPIINDLSSKLDGVLKTLDLWCPVARTGVIEKPVAPIIPEADGSEVRFSQVIARNGWQQKWAACSKEEKMAVYSRAAELHKIHYGAYPSKIMMWSSAGRNPMHYYTEQTCEKTILAALREWASKKGLIQDAEEIIDDDPVVRDLF